MRRDSAAALAAFAAVFAAYAGRHVAHWSRFVASGWDETWQIPIAWMLRDPELYAKDVLLHDFARWYPGVWERLLGALLAAFDGDFTSLLGAGSAALLAVFGLGNFALGRRLGGPWAGLVMAAVLLRPRAAAYNPYGVMIGNFTANNVGIAFSPWILWGLLAAEARAPRLALLGAALGALSLVNTSVAFHMALACVACRMLERDWRGAASLGAAFAPLFLCSSSLLHRGPSDPPDPEILRLRHPYLLAPWPSVASLPRALLLPAALALAAGRRFWTEVPDGRRLAAVGLFALAFGATAPIARAVPTFALALSWRALFLLFPVLFAAGAFALGRALEGRRREVLGGVLALWAACLLVTELPLPRPKEAPALSSDSSLDACRPEFLEVSDWAQDATPKDALFLVPPDSFAPFRLYAKRGVVVTVKEGTGFYEGSVARRWKALYDDARGAYAGGRKAVLEAARRHGADFAVLDVPNVLEGADKDTVFRNRCYAAVRTGGAP